MYARGLFLIRVSTSALFLSNFLSRLLLMILTSSLYLDIDIVFIKAILRKKHSIAWRHALSKGRGIQRGKQRIRLTLVSGPTSVRYGHHLQHQDDKRMVLIR